MNRKINPFKQWFARAAVCGAALVTALSGAVHYYAHILPDHYYLQADTPLTVETVLPVTVQNKPSAVSEMQEAELRLFGILPVKTVSVTPVSPVEVYLGGEPFGIRMLMAGVMVVSLSDIPTAEGNVCPAKDAGIEVGDMIQEIDGVRISSNAGLQKAVSDTEGKPMQVTLRRKNDLFTLQLQPAYALTAQRWQTGMWVRDSTAGIGTVTYYHPSAGGQIQFAGLGHAVCDADTGEQIPLAEGDVIGVSVRDVIAGRAGAPGELRGRFDSGSEIGILQSNSPSGLFGIMNRLPEHPVAIPLGFRQDISRGEAQIYTTLSGTKPQPYSVEIEEIRDSDTAMRNLVIRVTDPALISQTGGIVQGMSGSPIVQNGKLIGAVTHVFVRDPTRGYGIFAENMYAQTAAQAVSAENAAAAAAAVHSGLPSGR